MSEPEAQPGRCRTCGHVRSPLWQCSAPVCPHRKPGTSMHGAEQLTPRNHDGTGWDRFYRGQHNPPDKEQ